MKFTKTAIEGLIILEPTIIEDERGYFFESFNKRVMPEQIAKAEWVQDNESKSSRGVLRGLHFQTGDMAQAKLIRVVYGEIYDVAVDIRSGSPTYGDWVGVTVNSENKKQLYIPRGFAHGFVVLSEEAVFMYKCDNYYSSKEEGGIIYNDPDLNIKWPLQDSEIRISEKDKNQPLFKNHLSA